mmetsp:Transcript_6979/g.22393  ORF Transcript_6979/g.22393 Transcript_6979/m.22393 type:complete len:237 (-) Transcript_6979:506-1216(-)
MRPTLACASVAARALRPLELFVFPSRTLQPEHGARDVRRVVNVVPAAVLPVCGRPHNLYISSVRKEAAKSRHAATVVSALAFAVLTACCLVGVHRLIVPRDKVVNFIAKVFVFVRCGRQDLGHDRLDDRCMGCLSLAAKEGRSSSVGTGVGGAASAFVSPTPAVAGAVAVDRRESTNTFLGKFFLDGSKGVVVVGCDAKDAPQQLTTKVEDDARPRATSYPQQRTVEVNVAWCLVK